MNTFPPFASVSDLQRRSADLIKQVKDTKEPLLILNKNKPEVVMLDVDIYNDLQQKVAVQEELQAYAALTTYTAEKSNGKLKKMKNLDELIS